MKKIIAFLLAIFVFIQISQTSASAETAYKTKYVNYVMEYMTNIDGYTQLTKKNFDIGKRKNGDIWVEYRDENGHYPAYFTFKKKDSFKRLYKLDLMEGNNVVVRYYSIKGKKGSKALKSSTAKKELKNIKKLAKKKKTVATKSLIIGTSSKNIQKKLGKPKKVYAPVMNVLYVYPKATISILSDYSNAKSTWVPRKNSKITSVDISKAKNKAFAYKDIKSVFGTNNSYTSFSHVYGYQTLSYHFKNYSITFYSTIYDQNNFASSLGLGENVLFNRYSVSAF